MLIIRPLLHIISSDDPSTTCYLHSQLNIKQIFMTKVNVKLSSLSCVSLLCKSERNIQNVRLCYWNFTYERHRKIMCLEITDDFTFQLLFKG